MKEILVIGGTGAQGTPVVHALALSTRYKVRVLTRDLSSKRAQDLAKLPNVELIQGSQDNQKDLHRAFQGVYGAWVNTDGFTLGEKNEMFYGIRAYEIARYHKVQHYVYASTDYALKDTDWNEEYHWGHNDAKGRVGEFILAQGQEGITSSLLVTGPYMNMLMQGMFVPQEQEDGSFVWANPAKDGKIPLIALEDVGSYSLWMFDNPKETAGMTLKVATEEVSFQDIVNTFTKVTGKEAKHQYLEPEIYFPLAEPWPNAMVNWAAGPDAPRDESTMTWRENFGAWWKYWGQGKCPKRDFGLMDKILPGRIRSLEEWMRKVDYDGKTRGVFQNSKYLEEHAAKMAEKQSASKGTS